MLHLASWANAATGPLAWANICGIVNYLGQIDQSGCGCPRQCRGQIVGLYPINTSSGLNDRVVNLDELFSVAGPLTQA
jgi:hypothetical protein